MLVLQFIAALLMFCKIEVIWRNKLLQKFPILALFWTINCNSFYLVLLISLKYKCGGVYCNCAMWINLEKPFLFTGYNLHSLVNFKTGLRRCNPHQRHLYLHLQKREIIASKHKRAKQLIQHHSKT